MVYASPTVLSAFGVLLLGASSLAERCLPFVAKVQNAKTLRAIEELESDGGFSANTVDVFMAALNTED